jgi:PAS domain-containing protein
VTKSFDHGSPQPDDRTARAARVLAALRDLWGDEPPPGEDPDLAWLVDALAIDDAHGRESGCVVRSDEMTLTTLAQWLSTPQFTDEDSAAWDFDPTTDLMSFDDRGRTVLGLGPTGVRLERALLDVHPHDRDHVEGALRSAAATGEHFRITLRGRSPEGRWLWRTSTGRRIVDADGQVRVVGFVTVHRDRVPVE